jgi:hypothetical protein
MWEEGLILYMRSLHMAYQEHGTELRRRSIAGEQDAVIS